MIESGLNWVRPATISFTDLVVGVRPQLDQALGHLVIGEHSAAELLVILVERSSASLIISSRRCGRVHVGDRDGEAVAGRPLEAHVLHVVEQLDRRAHAGSAVADEDHLGQRLLVQLHVKELVASTCSGYGRIVLKHELPGRAGRR